MTGPTDLDRTDPEGAVAAAAKGNSNWAGEVPTMSWAP